MTMQMTAHVTDAGISDARTEVRSEDGRFVTYQEKGGWMRLNWEFREGAFIQRVIQVTRMRAFQAMDALEKGRPFV